jgi:3'(2'), 5'-bisphosphate nucleotidase
MFNFQAFIEINLKFRYLFFLTVKKNKYLYFIILIMINMHTDSILLIAINAALKAGDAILQIYKRPFEVETKKDNSPITEADRQSNQLITDLLEETGFPVLSEEGKDWNYADRKLWEYFWLVDPLDGTKEFVSRNGEFTVNIALIEKNTPIAGVVYIPVKDTLYFANEKGAFRIDDCSSKNLGDSLEIISSNGVPLPESLSSETFRIVASRSHMNQETTDFIENLKKKHIDIVSAGSSLKFCQIAEGKADIYPRFGTTMEWDTAAGHAIVKYSGGKVLQAGTELELCYNKPDLRNPYFIASR